MTTDSLKKKGKDTDLGIEPTDHMISMRSDSFEDYGLHQQYKHFRRLPNLACSTEVLNRENPNCCE